MLFILWYKPTSVYCRFLQHSVFCINLKFDRLNDLFYLITGQVEPHTSRLLPVCLLYTRFMYKFPGYNCGYLMYKGVGRK